MTTHSVSGFNRRPISVARSHHLSDRLLYSLQVFLGNRQLVADAVQNAQSRLQWREVLLRVKREVCGRQENNRVSDLRLDFQKTRLASYKEQQILELGVISGVSDFQQGMNISLYCYIDSVVM